MIINKNESLEKCRFNVLGSATDIYSSIDKNSRGSINLKHQPIEKLHPCGLLSKVINISFSVDIQKETDRDIQRNNLE